MTSAVRDISDLPALRGARPRAGGFLDGLDAPLPPPSLGQRVFFHRLTARLYVVQREGLIATILTRRSRSHDAAWLVRALHLRDDSLVLDVPCGQGNLMVPLAQVLPRGRVIGIDLADTMLTLARERIARAGMLQRVVLVRGDAQRLPLRDGSVDAVSACGGLHLFPDPDQAIAEMRRVLRPGGRVAGLVFVAHRDPPRRMFQRLIKRVAGMNAFDFDDLGRRFEARGFTRWQWHQAGILGFFEATAA